MAVGLQRRHNKIPVGRLGGITPQLLAMGAIAPSPHGVGAYSMVPSFGCLGGSSVWLYGFIHKLLQPMCHETWTPNNRTARPHCEFYDGFYVCVRCIDVTMMNVWSPWLLFFFTIFTVVSCETTQKGELVGIRYRFTSQRGRARSNLQGSVVGFSPAFDNDDWPRGQRVGLDLTCNSL